MDKKIVKYQSGEYVEYESADELWTEVLDSLENQKTVWINIEGFGDTITIRKGFGEKDTVI